MPITELVFPSYKLDPQSVAGLQQKAPEILQTFSGIDGLQAAFHGPLLEENGVTIDPSSMKSLLVRDWNHPSSFHNFFPSSPKFEAFLEIVKPFSAAPAVPQLYEAEERSVSCTSSNITQIIRVKSSKETERTWKKLVGAITESATKKPSFFHASGIEGDEGMFLGLIGWESLQQYEQFGKSNSILESLEKLKQGGEVQNIIAQIAPLSNP